MISCVNMSVRVCLCLIVMMRIIFETIAPAPHQSVHVLLHETDIVMTMTVLDLFQQNEIIQIILQYS